MLDYSERYINIGSPSGYTIEDQLIDQVNPFSNYKSFQLYAASTKQFRKFCVIGDVPFIDNNDEFFIHPMMVSKYKKIGIEVKPSGFRVQPTSSGRTVVTRGAKRDYLKLHFDDVLGRVNRSITYTKAVAGVEIGQILERGLLDGVLNNKIGLLREKGAKVVWHDEKNTSAYIFRDGNIWCQDSEQIRYVLPLFSLFSEDRKSYKCSLSVDANLLIQKSRKVMVAEPNIFLNNIILPVIDLFFEAVLKLGLQIEFNAQNVLVTFDKDSKPIGIILRDFSAIEKDHGFQSNYWPNKFQSAPYKFIYPSDQNYQIRHSFAFDFKLSKYVIEPLLDLFQGHHISKRIVVLNDIRKHVFGWIKFLPENFFPQNAWYSHPKMLLTIERPYVRNEKPFLRIEDTYAYS